MNGKKRVPPDPSMTSRIRQFGVMSSCRDFWTTPPAVLFWAQSSRRSPLRAGTRPCRQSYSLMPPLPLFESAILVLIIRLCPKADGKDIVWAAVHERTGVVGIAFFEVRPSAFLASRPVPGHPSGTQQRSFINECVNDVASASMSVLLRSYRPHSCTGKVRRTDDSEKFWRYTRSSKFHSY